MKGVWILLNTMLLSVVLAGTEDTHLLGDLKFDHLTTRDGLSQNGVFGILQDRQGFLWFATRDGLNRYDGLRFRHYYRDFEDEHSLPSNQIQGIDEDLDGRIWIATDEGIASLDPITNRITRHPIEKTVHGMVVRQVYTVTVDTENRVWIGTEGGLYVFNRDLGHFGQMVIDRAPFNEEDAFVTRVVSVPGSPGVWVGTFFGVFHYQYDVGMGAMYFDDETIKGIPDSYVVSMCPGKEKVLWVACYGGLRRLDIAGDTFEKVSLPLPNADQGLVLPAVMEDHRGMVWLGTSFGLVLYRPEDGASSILHNDPADNRSLAGIRVQSLFEDESGIVWAGMYSSGINKYNRSSEIIAHHVRDPNEPKGSEFNLMLGLYEDASGGIWFGSYQGFGRFDQKTGEFNNFDLAHLPQLMGGTVYCLVGSDQGEIWIGSKHGLYLFSPETGEIQTFFHPQEDPSYLAKNTIKGLEYDSQGRLWAATVSGPGWLDRDTKTWTFFSDKEGLFPNEDITVLHRNGDDRFWLGMASHGLLLFDPATQTVKHYAPDPGDPRKLAVGQMLSLEMDRHGVLWAGSMGGGLCRFNREDDSFTRYTRADGLVNEKVFSIIADRYDDLWLGTNKGIVRFDPDSERFFNLDLSYNLQANEFSRGSAWLTRSGFVAMGGINGLNLFDPAGLKESEFQPRVVFTGVKAPGQPLNLERDITSLDELRLSHENRAITLQFASLDYMVPTENRFAYKVDGLVNHWVPLGHTGELTFPRLDPGRYTVRVKGTNRNGRFSEKVASLRLVVPPPWWHHPLAYLAYALVGLCLILLYLFYQRRLRKPAQTACGRKNLASGGS